MEGVYTAVTARAEQFTTARVYKNGLVIFYSANKRPGRSHDILKDLAKKKRSYSVKRTKLQSACVSAWLAKKSKFMLFVTFTFPFDVTEQTGASCFNSLLNNLRNNFKVTTYVWVKEMQKTGRLHYHIIVDRNRIDIKAVQKTWNNVITNITGVTPDFNNSVRLGPNPVVYSVERVKRYLSKYISKTENKFSRKAYGYTENLSLYDDFLITDFVNYSNKLLLPVVTLDVLQGYEILFIQNYTGVLRCFDP